MEKKIFYFAVFTDGEDIIITDATTNPTALESQIDFFNRKMPIKSKSVPKRFMLTDDGKEVNAINFIKEGFEHPKSDRIHHRITKRRKYTKRKFNGFDPNDTTLKTRKLKLGLTDAEIALEIKENAFNVNRVLNDKHGGISDKAFDDTYRKINELFTQLEK